jgi:hypothetical protein
MKETILLLGLECGAKPGAIKKWRQRGFVTHKWRLKLLRAAKRHGWPLSERDFDFEPSSAKERERQQEAASA